MRRVARLGVASVLAIAAILATMAVATTSAVAQQVVYVQGEDIPVTDPSAFGPAGVAADHSSGDVYAAVPFAATVGGSTILRFDATGAPLGDFASNIITVGLAVGPPGTGQASNVFALDAGFLDGAADINTFSPTGTPIGSPFAVDYVPSEPLPTPQIATLASEGSTLIFYPNAVDDVVDMFSPDGTLLTSWNGTDAATTLVDPISVGVDSNLNIYVVDAADGGRVVKISAFTGSASVLPGTTGAVTVAVNPTTGDVFVGQGSGAAFHVTGFDSSGAQIADFGAGDFADGNPFPRRIAVNSDSSRVYVSDSGGTPKRIAVYEEGAPPPVVTTMSASGVRQTTATFAGTVAQSEVAAIDSCRFEYTDDADHQANGFANADEAPCTSEYPSGGASLILATADVSGLDPNTTYHFRLAASNSGGTGEGGDVVFQTLPNAPTVVTAAAGDVQHTRATLGGAVNPNGGPVTSCEIEFGTTTAYGQSRPCAPTPGGGTSAVGVSADVAGLAPGTIYHFRVRAVNGGGATDGANGTFKTPDRPDPCAVDPNSCKPTDQCVVTPASCKPPPVALKASVPGRIAVRAGRALIRVSCKGPAGATCKGTLRLRARIDPPGRRKARTLTIGRARYELPAGTTKVVRVKLSRPARRSLARKGRLRGRITGPVVSDRSVLFRLRPSD
jgi:hypothetical protein